MQGAWPPYMKGDRGYVKMFVQLAKGIISTMQAIKSVQPDAKMVHVEAAGITKSSQPETDWFAEQNRLKGFLSFDLTTGRVTPDHPLYGWLLQSGARPRDLEWIARRPITIDVMGLNFYPQWSTQELYLDDNGYVASRIIDHDGSGFGEMVEDFYRRYGVPVMITETSARDSEEYRIAWLKNSLGMIKDLRERGVPVLGYTWFPLFTMIDWRYRTGRRARNDYLIELGLYHGKAGADDRVEYIPTDLVDAIRSYTLDPDAAIGELRMAQLAMSADAVMQV